MSAGRHLSDVLSSLTVRALLFANSQGTELVAVYTQHGRVCYHGTGGGYFAGTDSNDVKVQVSAPS